MKNFLNLILVFLSQFAGGPGPPENNLIRFGFPAVLWAVLLYIAWSRQRDQNRPREKLLIWGFGLALLRELYMFGHLSYRLIAGITGEANCGMIQPLEHGLAMAAMIVVAGAFLNYILQDQKITLRYLRSGIGLTLIILLIASYIWLQQTRINPQIKFHQTLAAWLFHIPLSLFMVAAVLLMCSKKGWLKNTVATALIFYFISELLLLVNYATDRVYNTIFCPIGNSFHIFAIPLLGYVYLREQSIEKKQAEEALVAYRDHLEEIINERHAELTAVNEQLQQEISVRVQAETTLERVTYRYRLILESTGEGICGIDRQGRIIFANLAAARILGYTVKELINQVGYHVWHNPSHTVEAHLEQECPIHRGHSQGIQSYGDDEFFWRQDGTRFPVRYFSNPVYEQDTLTGSVLVFQDITERKHNEIKIAQRTASLATQNAIAAALSQSLEINKNTQIVLRMIQDEADMEIGVLFLLDQKNKHLHPQFHIGLVSNEDLIHFTERGGACQQFLHKALFFKKAILARSIPAFLIKALDIHSMVSIPLMSKGRRVGTILLAARRDIVPPKEILDLLTAVGQQIGMAIENARLYSDAENWAKELTRLHLAGDHLNSSFDPKTIYKEIASQSASLLNCGKACVLQLHPKTNPPEITGHFGFSQTELQTLAYQLQPRSNLSAIFDQHTTVAINATSAHRQALQALRIEHNLPSALFVPIWLSNDPQVYLVLLDTRPSRQWRSRELELIEHFANRAAVALINASLHQQLELAAALEERRRIAANMHDGLAQTLAFLGLQVDQLQELTSNTVNTEIETAVARIRAGVTSATENVRRSITNLQAVTHPQSSLQTLLLGALKQLQPIDGPELHIDLDQTQDLCLPPDQLDQIMPLVQEAVLNAYRHANAQVITIQAKKTDLMINILIEDDGCGFDLTKPFLDGSHFGIGIMQARAARIGGNLQIDTAPTKGTKITLSWIPDQNPQWDAAHYLPEESPLAEALEW